MVINCLVYHLPIPLLGTSEEGRRRTDQRHVEGYPVNFERASMVWISFINYLRDLKYSFLLLNRSR